MAQLLDESLSKLWLNRFSKPELEQIFVQYAHEQLKSKAALVKRIIDDIFVRASYPLKCFEKMIKDYLPCRSIHRHPHQPLPRRRKK